MPIIGESKHVGQCTRLWLNQFGRSVSFDKQSAKIFATTNIGRSLFIIPINALDNLINKYEPKILINVPRIGIQTTNLRYFYYEKVHIVIYLPIFSIVYHLYELGSRIFCYWSLYDFIRVDVYCKSYAWYYDVDMNHSLIFKSLSLDQVWLRQAQLRFLLKLVSTFSDLRL